MTTRPLSLHQILAVNPIKVWDLSPHPAESELASQLVTCSRLAVADGVNQAAWHASTALLELCYSCCMEKPELACWMTRGTVPQPLHRPIQQPCRHVTETMEASQPQHPAWDCGGLGEPREISRAGPRSVDTPGLTNSPESSEKGLLFQPLCVKVVSYSTSWNFS